MKINIITTEAGKIISRNTIIKLNVNPFDVEANPETITDPDPEKQAKLIADTKKVMDMILVNPEKVVRRVMILGINHSRMDEIAALTASDLKQVVDSVMGQNLTYIIGDGSSW